MKWEPVLDWLETQYATTWFEIAGAPIGPKAIVAFAVIVGAAFVVSWLVQRAVRRFARGVFEEDPGTGAAVNRLLHYVILLVGIGIALDNIGISMSALFAAGAVFAIAVGFAMQNVLQNFVAGVILLMERSIKPGDILEVEGDLIQVKEMGVRATVAKTLLREDVIIPNGILVQSQVKNYTMRDKEYRLGTTVGVVYGSDMRQVFDVLTRTAEALPWRVQSVPPSIFMREFGGNAVNFKVFVTVNDPWQRNKLLSDLNTAIWFALKEAGIVIAFPQLDVHFDPPVTAAVESLAAAKAG